MADIVTPINTDQPLKICRELTVVESTRRAQRKKLADTWLSEEENSRYRYDVEMCSDGKKIFLLRPTFLNKGFDFQINVEGFGSGKRQAPKHEDIYRDIEAKAAESQHQYGTLRDAIQRVFECGEPDDVLKKLPPMEFKSGFPVDKLLKVLKWLFIEQDLTYWNNSGRRMFMEGISEIDEKVERASAKTAR